MRRAEFCMLTLAYGAALVGACGGATAIDGQSGRSGGNSGIGARESGGTVGSGGRTGSGGSATGGGVNAPDCPETAPSDGRDCFVEGKRCTYVTAVKSCCEEYVVAGCIDGSWNLEWTDCDCPEPWDCDPGETICGDACANLLSDPNHCGACGVVCPIVSCSSCGICDGYSVCSGGVCTSDCAAGTQACEASCVDVCTNVLHCGACGNPCARGAVCTGGVCKCQGDSVDCGGACVDLSNDNDNCGGCGISCRPQGATCDRGVCVCPPGWTICSDRCVDLLTNDDHCGRCLRGCDADTTCINGVCSCDAGLTVCNGECVDLLTDEQHCGQCLYDCPADTFCEDGECVAVGWYDCARSEDCLVTYDDCCGDCGMYTVENAVAIHRERLDEYRASMCSVDCPPCASSQHPSLAARCRANRCEVLDLSESEVTVCDSDSDCVIRSQQCCECDAPDEHIAIAATERESYESLVCEPGQGCDDCAPAYPDRVTPFCSDGFCWVQEY